MARVGYLADAAALKRVSYRIVFLNTDRLSAQATGHARVTLTRPEKIRLHSG